MIFDFFHNLTFEWFVFDFNYRDMASVSFLNDLTR